MYPKRNRVPSSCLAHRPGQALHFHILFLDGAYVYRDNRPPQFQRVRAPDKSELEDLVHLISQRAGRCAERLGLLEQDAESAWLALEPQNRARYPEGLLIQNLCCHVSPAPYSL